jgi:hypothetical protein
MIDPEFTSRTDDEIHFDLEKFNALSRMRMLLNYDAALMGSASEPYPWEPGHILEVESEYPSHSAVIKVGNAAKTIGYFNPATSNYRFYSDYIEQGDAETLQKLTLLKRSEAFHDFFENGKSKQKWMDYSHPLVTDLHERHNNALVGGGLAATIAEFHNYHLPADKKSERFETDEESSVAVYLEDSVVSNTAESADHTLGLRLLGSFIINQHGINLNNRMAVRRVDLAKKVMIGDSSFYVPLEQKGEQLISRELLDDLEQLTGNIKVLRDYFNESGFVFNATSLAVELSPGQLPPIFGPEFLWQD